MVWVELKASWMVGKHSTKERYILSLHQHNFSVEGWLLLGVKKHMHAAYREKDPLQSGGGGELGMLKKIP